MKPPNYLNFPSVHSIVHLTWMILEAFFIHPASAVILFRQVTSRSHEVSDSALFLSIFQLFKQSGYFFAFQCMQCYDISGLNIL